MIDGTFNNFDGWRLQNPPRYDFDLPDEIAPEELPRCDACTEEVGRVVRHAPPVCDREPIPPDDADPPF